MLSVALPYNDADIAGSSELCREMPVAADWYGRCQFKCNHVSGPYRTVAADGRKAPAQLFQSRTLFYAGQFHSIDLDNKRFDGGDTVGILVHRYQVVGDYRGIVKSERKQSIGTADTPST